MKKSLIIIVIALILLSIPFLSGKEYPATIANDISSYRFYETQNIELYSIKDIDKHIINELEQVAKEVKFKFDYKSREESKYIVIIADMKQLIESNVKISGACFDGEAIIIDEYKVGKKRLNNTIRHEMIHASTFKNDAYIPGWFQEGIAFYYQSNINNKFLSKGQVDRLREAYNNGELIEVQYLEKDSGRWKVKDTSLAYYESAAIYHYLKSSYIEEDIIGLFYKQGDFYENLEAITKLDREELFSRVLDSIL